LRETPSIYPMVAYGVFMSRESSASCISSMACMGIYNVPVAWKKAGSHTLISDISTGSLLRRELFCISIHKHHSSWRQPVMHRCSTRLLWCAASSSRAPLDPWPSSRMERCLVSPALHALAGKSTSHDPIRCVSQSVDFSQSPVRLQPRCLRRCPGDERLWQTHGRLHRELFEDGLAGVDP
jgi:hypothetical protein